MVAPLETDSFDDEPLAHDDWSARLDELLPLKRTLLTMNHWHHASRLADAASFVGLLKRTLLTMITDTSPSVGNDDDS